jgi:glyoxylase I family protein
VETARAIEGMSIVSQTDGPIVVGLDHSGFVVTNLAAASAFFVDVLGFEALPRKGVIRDDAGDNMTGWFGTHPRSVSRFAFFKLGDGLIELLEWDSPDRDAEPANNSDASGRHLSLFVKSLDAIRGALADQPGVEFREVTERGFVYIKTPFGLELQLVPLS